MTEKETSLKEAAERHQFAQDGVSHWELSDSFIAGAEWAEERLKAENARIREELSCAVSQLERDHLHIHELQEENARLREALEKIVSVVKGSGVEFIAWEALGVCDEGKPFPRPRKE